MHENSFLLAIEIYPTIMLKRRLFQYKCIYLFWVKALYKCKILAIPNRTISFRTNTLEYDHQTVNTKIIIFPKEFV